MWRSRLSSVQGKLPRPPLGHPMHSRQVLSWTPGDGAYLISARSSPASHWSADGCAIPMRKSLYSKGRRLAPDRGQHSGARYLPKLFWWRVQSIRRRCRRIDHGGGRRKLPLPVWAVGRGSIGCPRGKEKAPRNGGAEVYGDMKKGPTGQGPEPQRLSQVPLWIATEA